MHKVLLLVSGLVACLCTCAVAEDLTERKVHVMDSALFGNGQYNFIFRGDQPRNDSGNFGDCGTKYPLTQCFAIDQLKSYMASQAAAETTVPFPSRFFILDISFIYDNIPVESTDLKMEEQFWDAHPNDGILWHWPLYGEKECARYMSESARLEKAKTFDQWSRDKLPQKMEQLHTLIHSYSSQNGSVPLVIYGHCEHGTDRTGEYGASYEMMVGKSDFVTAMSFNWKVSERPILLESFCAAQWMCLWLEAAKGYKNLKCMDFIWP
eukprot:ANDGO_08499.mRNA.1 hypothetical protein DDB_G0285459